VLLGRGLCDGLVPRPPGVVCLKKCDREASNNEAA
jgi:hypothetical protein